MYKRNQQETSDSALWDTRQNRSTIRFYSVYNNSLLSVAQKRIDPFQRLPTYRFAVAKQFARVLRYKMFSQNPL